MFTGIYVTLFTLLFFYLIPNAQSYNLFGFPGLGYLVEVKLGNPPQKLNVLLDTGSSSLAVASPNFQLVSKYFHVNESKTARDTKMRVCTAYSQAKWCGNLINDFVGFSSFSDPSLVVRSDIVLISEQDNFFVEGSDWQGILGLAYKAIAAYSSDKKVQAIPLVDNVKDELDIVKSFEITLCGVHSNTNVSHYGQFNFLDDKTIKPNSNRQEYKTPILLEAWYEVGVLNIRVIDSINGTNAFKNSSIVERYDRLEDACVILNSKRGFVDSGATNIVLPSKMFTQIVHDLRSAAHMADLLILNELFWFHGEANCWPQPQVFDLPKLAIDLLDMENDNQYFTLEIPPENYIRLVSGSNSSGTISEFCYRFGLEMSPNGITILGGAAMEGFQIIFNRSSGYLSFSTSDCGPEVNITGPHRLNGSILDLCGLKKYTYVSYAGSIRIAKWICVVAFAGATTLLLYLWVPCLKRWCVSSVRRPRISFFRENLVPLES